MRNAKIALGIISKRGSKKQPIERIYRLLYNPELYQMAYRNIYANDGAMTKGSNDETVDGMSMKKIMDIIGRVKTETYQWTPVRRTHIKKSNGKLRPLGLPTWSDKLLQEAMRIILEAYYDGQFSENSHGFREGRGCQTALEAITRKGGWKSVKWFVEGDIANCFGSIDHEILMNILKERIKDNRFLRLIENLLKSGYMENWKHSPTLSGCPQGSILSPILSNVYMDKLDKYVENELIPKYTKGKRRAENKEYKAIMNQIAKYKRHQNWEKARELEKISQTMASKEPTDPNFRRLYYIRYADDWLIGLSGSREEAEEVKTQIGGYLHGELKLELSGEKTLVTHARNEKARFLGYDIHVLHADTKHDHRGQRIINGAIGLRVPRDKMQAKMSEYMARGKPIHRKERTINSDYDIISQYQSELRGFVQYYLHAYNAHEMHNVKRAMEMSLAKTLANKYKTTSKRIFDDYKTTVETENGKYKVLQAKVERENKSSLIAQFGGIRIAYDKEATITDAPKQIYNVKSQLIDRLTRKVCELCGTPGETSMHHVRKLKDLSKSGRKNKPEWMKRMIAMNRKTLAVCDSCHNKIHSGEYDGPKVC